MSQDYISLTLTPEQVTGASDGLDLMAASLSGLKATPEPERGNLLYMGAKSEVFCRRALRILDANPQIVPPSLAADLAGANADLAALDQLRPLQERLQKLLSLIGDSIDLLGSDAMHVALDAYAQLKLSGGDAGLEELRKELGSRWSQGGRARAESPTPAPTPTPTPAPTPVLDPA
ncbi:hypothetical protein [Lysobacter sp. F6437]|uniref:hypothetical protein n=1 Tax=Lysobacter sp. F6437 TaxID=3459296 RepID=UPI00403DCF6B